MNSPWRLSLFGAVGLRSGEREITSFETKRAAKLLVLLSSSRTGTMRRDELADLLWPDDFIDSTRLRLRQELSRLRRALGDAEGLIDSNTETVSIDRSQLYNDWDLLKSPQGLCPEELVDILTGSYLPGWDDLWAISQRDDAERLRVEVGIAASRRFIDHGLLSEALEVAEATQKLAPKNDEIRDMLMRIHADKGSLSQALATFRLHQRGDTATITVPETKVETAVVAGPTTIDLPPVPHPIDRFHGRQRMLQDIASLLDDPTVRLITFVGTGGIGKSRLATEAVKEVSGSIGFVSFIEFHPDTSAEHYLADRLLHGNVTPQPLDGLKRQFHNHPCLLILDNLELVPDPGAFVSSLLSSVPGIRLLVTSRRPMKIAGEHLVNVGPLDRALEGLPMLEGLLATQRISVDQTTLLTEIVDLCDGIPLTLRLAAARLRTMEPKELVEELRETVSTLAANSADLPERHRNLEKMLQVSLATLDATDVQILREISCFPGGVTRLIVRMKVGNEVDLILERLLDSSLIWINDEASPLRFQLLEPIRQYLHRSTAAEDFAACRTKFIDTMAEIAASFSSVWALPSDDERLLYRREATNFRAAVSLALELGLPKALDIFCKVWDWELASGRSTELLDLTATLLQKKDLTSAQLGQIWNCRAWCQSVSGDLRKAAEFAAEAKKHFLDAGLLGDAGYADALEHECLRNYSDWSDALVRYEQLIRSADEVAPILSSTIRVWRGKALAYRSEWDLAASDLEFGYQEAKTHRNISLQITAGSSLIFVDYARRDLELLKQRIAELDAIHAELDDPYSWSIFLRAVSRFEITQGNYVKAEELSRRCLDVFAFAGNAFHEVESRISMVRAQMAMSRLDDAKRTLKEIAAYFPNVLARVQVPSLVAIAEYWWLAGDEEKARSSFAQAKAHLEKTQAKLVLFEQEYFDAIGEVVGNPTAAPHVDEERLAACFVV